MLPLSEAIPSKDDRSLTTDHSKKGPYMETITPCPHLSVSSKTPQKNASRKRNRKQPSRTKPKFHQKIIIIIKDSRRLAYGDDDDDDFLKKKTTETGFARYSYYYDYCYVGEPFRSTITHTRKLRLDWRRETKPPPSSSLCLPPPSESRRARS